eukprot:768735-Hanusia_phi.AAC.2
MPTSDRYLHFHAHGFLQHYRYLALPGFTITTGTVVTTGASSDHEDPPSPEASWYGNGDKPEGQWVTVPRAEVVGPQWRGNIFGGMCEELGECFESEGTCEGRERFIAAASRQRELIYCRLTECRGTCAADPGECLNCLGTCGVLSGNI